MGTGGRREAAERGRESTQHPDILYGSENSYIGNSLGTCTLCSITSYLYYSIIPPPPLFLHILHHYAQIWYYYTGHRRNMQL